MPVLVMSTTDLHNTTDLPRVQTFELRFTLETPGATSNSLPSGLAIAEQFNSDSRTFRLVIQLHYVADGLPAVQAGHLDQERVGHELAMGVREADPATTHPPSTRRVVRSTGGRVSVNQRFRALR